MNVKKGLLFLILLVGLISLGACAQNTNKENETSNKNENETSNENENVAKEGMPIVEESIKLDMMAGEDITPADDWNDISMFNEYKERSNIDVNFEMIPNGSIEEKRNLRLVGGDLPDAFYRMGLSQRDLMKYGEQGILIELNDLIDDYAPNLKAIIEENPEVEKGMTMYDGKIYSFPSILEPSFISYRMGAKPYINRDWLDELDMEMPETTEEFYNYLTAIKEEDPGDNDGIPYGSVGINNLLGWIKGSFGVGNLGSNYYDDPNNEDQLRFYPTSEGYKEMLEYTNKLFSEELIEQNIFTIEFDQYLANAADGRYGSTNWWGPELQFGPGGAPLEGAPALEGPNGDKKYAGFSGPVASLGAFAITNSNENPEATVRWIDYFYGEEGVELMFMGLEGETFERTDDGGVKYMDYITDSDETLTQELNKFTIWGGGTPAMFMEDYFFGAESTDQELDAAERLKPNLIDNPTPQLPYNEEESKQLESIGADIEKYVGEMTDKFIEGQVSFDEWDDYVETLENMNLDNYMEIQQTAYERLND